MRGNFKMVKDDGARGAEITVMDGTIPYCPDCQVKHIEDLIAHIDPREKDKYSKATYILDKVRRQVGMTKTQEKDYRQIRELEHKFEDAMTVLRDLRHKVQATPAIDNPVTMAKCELEVAACMAKGKSESKCRVKYNCPP
jgi:hypothetical protein